MITIFVDASAALEPDAADRLRHLVEAGHRLVLVAPPDHRSVAIGGWSERRDRLPDEPARGSLWGRPARTGGCNDHKRRLQPLSGAV